jgi:ketosteroid isomerase-like protein
MKTISNSVLIGCAIAGLAFAAAAPLASADEAAKAPGVSQTVQQVEKDWAAAEQAGDSDKLSQFLADDWTAWGPEGKKFTKAQFVSAVKTGKMKVESMEFGSMDVKVLGSVAVVQGSDTEKSTFDGKDSSGKYVWTDVFAKRGGNWVAVRSQVALVK